MKALIYAAGLGTRLKNYTSETPKALIEVGGKPLLQHLLEKIISYNITEITINIHHFADQIISFLREHENFNINIHLSDERENLLDTGGGLKKAKQFLYGDEPILIHNVDVISDLDLNVFYNYHIQYNAIATLVVRNRETKRYLMFDEELELTGWTNKENGQNIISRKNEFNHSSPYAFSGIHIIQPKFLNMIEEVGRFSIIDTYLRLAEKQRIKAFIDDSELWMDLGKPDQLELAEKVLLNMK